jgi:hypothetical protein
MTTWLVLIHLLTCIVLPLACAWRVWRLDESSRSAWLLKTAESGAIVILVILVGRWDMAGYYTRFVLLALFVAAAVWSWFRHRHAAWRSNDGPAIWRTHMVSALSLLMLAAALGYVGYGLLPVRGAHDLTFPLRGGRFMVAHGGNVSILNHHANHPEQRYASDITAIDGAGFRAAGILPDALDRYEVYEALVVSPCDGQVTQVRDGMPDLTPPLSDPRNPRGNYVRVACSSGIDVDLAHLKEDSVRTSAGAQVAAGESIGRVGNSGNTTEPHLHVHASDPGTRIGVPVTFGGTRPIRNTVFESE